MTQQRAVHARQVRMRAVRTENSFSISDEPEALAGNAVRERRLRRRRRRSWFFEKAPLTAQFRLAGSASRNHFRVIFGECNLAEFQTVRQVVQ